MAIRYKRQGKKGRGGDNMMDLESAIQHCEEVMMENLEKTKDRNASDPIAINCFECADEHRQLAEWLKELKMFRYNESNGGLVEALMHSEAENERLHDELEMYRKNTCGDAVSRAIVQEEITKSIELKENPYQLWYRIRALPSVTPQQRTGRWIQKEEEGDAEPFIIWECSECHCVDEDGKPSYKYCPQCGAKMEVEE